MNNPISAKPEPERLPDNTDQPLPDLSRVFFGIVKYPPGGHLGPRIQRGIQFVYLISGGLEIEVDGVRTRIKPGNLVLMLPGRQESYYFHPDQESEHSWCQLDFYQLPQHWVDYLQQLPVQLTVTPEMEQLLELGLMISGNSQMDQQAVLKRLGEALLQFYLAITRVPNDERADGIPRSVHRACRFMARCYSQPISLEQLAEQAHCSVNHLINQFNRCFQTTPMRYLWRLRIRQSEGLLRHTELPIALIAEQCGFVSAFHFSRQFKAAHGVSPKTFREQFREPLRDTGKNHSV